MNPEKQLQIDIMMRVKTIRTLRVFLTLTFISPLIMIALMVWGAFIISFDDILTNTMAHESIIDAFSYVFSSLMHSRVIVQILTSIITIFGIALAFSYLRKIKIPIWHGARFRA